jgi:hypothetical protein
MDGPKQVSSQMTTCTFADSRSSDHPDKFTMDQIEVGARLADVLRPAVEGNRL